MDPYTSPLTSKQIEPETTDRLDENHFRQIVISWERLRIIYNVILLIMGVLGILSIINYDSYYDSYYGNHYGNGSDEILIISFFFGIFANVCFFAGPICEVYIRAFKHITNAKPLRRLLFTAGTIFSLIPILIAILEPALIFASYPL